MKSKIKQYRGQIISILATALAAAVFTFFQTIAEQGGLCVSAGKVVVKAGVVGGGLKASISSLGYMVNRFFI